MTKIQGSKDCGNSPKNQFVQDVAVALETGEFSADQFGDDSLWYKESDQPLRGKSAIADALSGDEKPTVVTVEHAISHGKVGAASGETTLKSGKVRRFSHVFEFTTTKGNAVAVVKSYAS